MDVILELMTGRILEATLANPFNPEDNEVDVFVEGYKEQQKFLFPEISCILMKSYQNWMSLFQKDTFQEEVKTLIGKTYKVNVSEVKSYPSGFFGLSVQEDTPYRLIFFTTFGAKTRCQTRAVGEILRDEGMISSDSIQKVLEEQNRIKKQLVGEIIAEASNLPQDYIENTLERAKKSIRKLALRVGEILIDAVLVTQVQVKLALTNQEDNKKKKIGKLLVESGFITEDQLLVALAKKFRLQMVDLENMVPNMKALEALPPDVIHRLQVFPTLDKGDRLIVATSQPTDYNIYEHLRFYTGRTIEMVVATSKQISEAIEKYFPKAGTAVDALIGELSVEKEVEDKTTMPKSAKPIHRLLISSTKSLWMPISKALPTFISSPGSASSPFR